MCTNFQERQKTLTFPTQICPKMDLWLKIQKINVRIRINILEISCANFQAKQTTLTSSAQICIKMNFGLGFLKP